MVRTESRKEARQVLLVEDEPFAEMVLSLAVKSVSPSIAITSAKSVEEALAKLGLQNYDLIIADIFLEGEATGLDFWHNCQDRVPDVPFVVTSGLPIEKFFKAIGSEAISPPFLAKPLDIQEVAQTIEGLLSEEVH